MSNPTSGRCGTVIVPFLLRVSSGDVARALCPMNGNRQVAMAAAATSDQYLPAMVPNEMRPPNIGSLHVVCNRIADALPPDPATKVHPVRAFLPLFPQTSGGPAPTQS